MIPAGPINLTGVCAFRRTSKRPALFRNNEFDTPAQTVDSAGYQPVHFNFSHARLFRQIVSRGAVTISNGNKSAASQNCTVAITHYQYGWNMAVKSSNQFDSL
ncbi:MAG TPA: hypothetical protein VKV04_20020 [Verrucomicrobiae bacterium]|nr:hypothetical protein [Verrucomicrobiae bacterium]